MNTVWLKLDLFHTEFCTKEILLYQKLVEEKIEKCCIKLILWEMVYICVTDIWVKKQAEGDLCLFDSINNKGKG